MSRIGFRGNREVRARSTLFDIGTLGATWGLEFRCAVSLSTDYRLGAATNTCLVVPDGTGTGQSHTNCTIPATDALWAFSLYLPDEPAAGDNIDIRISNDTGAVTNSHKFSFNANILRQGRNILVINLASPSPTYVPLGYAFTVAGTGMDYRLPVLRLGLDYTNFSQSQNIYLDSIEIGRWAKPAVILGFDDFQSDLVDYAEPTLTAAGMVAYIASSANGNAAQYDLVLSEVAALKAAGWPVINHSFEHPVGGYPALTAAEIAADVTRNVTEMDSRGWLDNQDTLYRNLFVYPGNLTDAATDATMASLGFVSCREIRNRRVYTSSLGVDNARRMGALSLTSALSLANAKAAIDDAISTGSTIMIYGHNLTTGAAGALSWNTSDFDALIDYIRVKRTQGLIDTPTWADWYRTIAGGRINATTGRVSA